MEIAFFYLFIFPHGSHLFVFIFCLWKDKLFLHVLCILKQIFNYPFSTVLMWTYEQLLKVQINVPHFQLFVTIFGFWETSRGSGLSHPHLVGCFGISANSMASVVKAEKERAWRLHSHCSGVCSDFPGQTVYVAGMEMELSLGRGHPTGQRMISKGRPGVHSFTNSLNDSCTSTMCLKAQIRTRILCSDYLNLEISTDYGLWDIAN